MHRSRDLVYYLAVISLLLLQFFLRAYHPAELPVYIDEYRHVVRGQMVYQFDQNPIEFAHGKLLLYYWLGLFGGSNSTMLIAGRLAIALVSLVTAAASSAIARVLFGRAAVLPALVFYALVPHTVFYERLALADPFAGALATLTIWATLNLVRHPTTGRSIYTGLLAGASTFAKLTTAAMIGMPLVAAILLGGVLIRERSRQAINVWSQQLWDRYGRFLNTLLLIYAACWAVIGALMLVALANGRQPIFLDFGLVGVRALDASGLQTRWETLVHIMRIMVSGPMLLVLLGFTLFLLVQHAAKTLFVIVWLLALWVPSVVLGWAAISRYLMTGEPALAVLFGGGIACLAEWVSRRVRAGSRRLAPQVAAALTSVIVIPWGVGYALPFAADAATDPVSLTLPDMDRFLFFSSNLNGWGVRESLAYLEQHGERIDDQLPVVGAVHTMPKIEYCDMVDVYLNANIYFRCAVQYEFDGEEFPPDPETWPLLANALDSHAFVYVITDAALGEEGGAGGELEVERLFSSQRPHGGDTISVWRVTQRAPG